MNMNDIAGNLQNQKEYMDRLYDRLNRPLTPRDKVKLARLFLGMGGPGADSDGDDLEWLEGPGGGVPGLDEFRDPSGSFDSMPSSGAAEQGHTNEARPDLHQASDRYAQAIGPTTELPGGIWFSSSSDPRSHAEFKGGSPVPKRVIGGRILRVMAIGPVLSGEANSLGASIPAVNLIVTVGTYTGERDKTGQYMVQRPHRFPSKVTLRNLSRNIYYVAPGRMGRGPLEWYITADRVLETGSGSITMMVSASDYPRRQRSRRR